MNSIYIALPNKFIKKYTRCNSRDNTKKLGEFISIVVPHKKTCYFFGVEQMQINIRNKHKENLKLKFDKRS